MFRSLMREAHAAQSCGAVVAHDLAALDALACRVVEVADHKARNCGGVSHDLCWLAHFTSGFSIMFTIITVENWMILL